VDPEGGSARIGVSVGRDHAPLLAAKGSVALDGVSLTVNEVAELHGAPAFTVNVIPHTKSCTTFAEIAEGRQLNVEIDVLARYIERMLRARSQ